jgi:hypothetical protein
MSETFQPKKIRFWINWTLLHTLVIPASYVLSLIAVALVHEGIFGFGETEGGTPLSQTLMQIAGGAVIGLGVGILQQQFLKKIFDVSSFWIYAIIIGFVMTELITCIILWQMGRDRWPLRFIEFNPLPEAMIFAAAGLLIGLLQWSVLKKHFTRSVFWIFASTLGWGMCILMIFFAGLFIKSSISVFTFIIGALLYGLITGATIMWLIQKREK